MAKATNTKPVEFSDIEKVLKEQYQEFMDHPENFGVDKKELAFMGKDPITIRLCYQMFKDQAMSTLADLNAQQFATVLAYDLRDSSIQQENGKYKANAKAIDLMLKNPEDPKYNLEKETIEEIKSMSGEEKKALKAEMLANHSIHSTSDSRSSHIKEDFKKFFGVFADKLEEFTKNILIKLIPIAEKIVLNAIESSNKNALVKQLGTETVAGVGDALLAGIKATDDNAEAMNSLRISEHPKSDVSAAGDHHDLHADQQ